MIHPKDFCRALKQNGVSFFAGVPDSLLKDICAYIEDTVSKDKHIICANEGGAIALASGYHLATDALPLVYMQNSGLGNAVNPLLSLVEKSVYGIPMLIIVGWRGEPGTKDEPQHKVQGGATISMLQAMSIPHTVIDEKSDIFKKIKTAAQKAKAGKTPYVLVVRKDALAPYRAKRKKRVRFGLSREEAIRVILGAIDSHDIVIGTTGKTSREIFELREARKEGHEKDFLTVGSMGHASQIALGIALEKPTRRVWCLDGDGAALMHMGALAIIGTKKPKNFVHVLLNNGAHESVGGQPTAGFEIDFPTIAKACGYRKAMAVENAKDFLKFLKKLNGETGPIFLEVKIDQGSRSGLGRPTTTPAENKESFMKHLRS